MSRRVSFDSCDQNDKQQPTTLHKAAAAGGNKRRYIISLWTIKISSSKSSIHNGFSAENFLKRVGEKVTKALSLISIKRSSNNKVSSSTLPRSRSYAEPLDSYRAEAIQDCIHFLNSSSSSYSSLQKSNSVS